MGGASRPFLVPRNAAREGGDPCLRHRSLEKGQKRKAVSDIIFSQRFRQQTCRSLSKDKRPALRVVGFMKIGLHPLRARTLRFSNADPLTEPVSSVVRETSSHFVSVRNMHFGQSQRSRRSHKRNGYGDRWPAMRLKVSFETCLCQERISQLEEMIRCRMKG